jgi:hypothetical protein
MPGGRAAGRGRGTSGGRVPAPCDSAKGRLTHVAVDPERSAGGRTVRQGSQPRRVWAERVLFKMPLIGIACRHICRESAGHVNTTTRTAWPFVPALRPPRNRQDHAVETRAAGRAVVRSHTIGNAGATCDARVSLMRSSHCLHPIIGPSSTETRRAAEARAEAVPQAARSPAPMPRSATRRGRFCTSRPV